LFHGKKSLAVAYRKSKIVDFGTRETLVQFYRMPQTLPTSIKGNRKRKTQKEELPREAAAIDNFAWALPCFIS